MCQSISSVVIIFFYLVLRRRLNSSGNSGYTFRIGKMRRNEADFSEHECVIHAPADYSFVRISLQDRGDVSDAKARLGSFLLSFLE